VREQARMRRNKVNKSTQREREEEEQKTKKKKKKKKNAKRFVRGSPHSASDDQPLSPKTNSACPAGCRIASLA
jgi:hypothetical protein